MWTITKYYVALFKRSTVRDQPLQDDFAALCRSVFNAGQACKCCGIAVIHRIPDTAARFPSALSERGWKDVF